MIGYTITSDKDGNPLDNGGTKLAESAYQPPEEIKKLFARCQTDYQTAWRLQHRTFREFDEMSVLDRARLDQETFGAFVGAEFLPATKSWRWKGRKNTARNKVIGILAHLISGMLFPYFYAYNEENEEDETTAKVLSILVEDHLKKADYEMKFLYMVTSALVNPAVHIEVEYVEAMQKIKEKMGDGTYKITDAVDMLLSGIGLNIIPIDQILPADFYTNDIQRQPYMIRVRRIAYDEARKIYSKKYFIDGVDQFDFVQAGKTRIFLAGQEHQTLYDIEWTEADRNYVQEITFQYRPEDLEVTFVAGVLMANYDDVYNSNPFKHRRMSLIGDEWKTIPIYNYAKTGFEPLDPAGRFYYYKSACFKEFWDDASINRAYQLAQDGMFLDVIKPIFLSGVAKIDQTVMVPGATVAMPQGATATPYSLSPNLTAALDILRTNKDDISESTQDSQQSGMARPGITATASMKAEQQAQVILGVFSTMIADLIRQIGELAADCVIQHTTIGQLDTTVPESLKMKFKTILTKGKEKGKEITHRIDFDTDLMGMDLTKEKASEMEWDMLKKMGGTGAKMSWWRINPYKFARTQFNCYCDPSQIMSRSLGTDQLRKERALNLLLDPRISPYVNIPEVVDEFILKEFGGADPDKFKKTPEQMQQEQQMQGGNSEMLNNIMSNLSLGVVAGANAKQ